jgi:hypothetical protein
MEPVPDLVTLHLWGVPDRRVPQAVLRMALDRGRLRRVPGLRFAKLLGTGDGRTFTLRDADRNHWGLLASWDSAAHAAAFETGAVPRAWERIATERLRIDLRPLASRGTWSGRDAFGSPTAPVSPGHQVPPPARVTPAAWPALATPAAAAPAYDGPVGAITRARIRPRHWRRFWRAVPPVSADLHQYDGLRLAVGIGEAPVGLQGTFSLWHSARALEDFAYRGAPHAEVIRRTREIGWYAEELFARFAVLDIAGTFAGRTP